MVMLFLGIRDGRYIGGRLGNYTETPEALAVPICAALERIRTAVGANPCKEPFDLTGVLMAAADLEEAK